MAKKIKTIIKFFISFLLLCFVLSKIDIKELLKILKEINLFWLFLAFLFYNLSKIIAAVRLNYYFKEIGINLSFKTNLILYYVGMFYNLFLPGGIGGDGYKAYLLKKHFDKKLSLLIAALLFDRISGLVALILLASLLFVFSDYAIYPLNILSIIIGLAVFFGFYFFCKKYNKFALYLNKNMALAFNVQLLQLLSAFFIILSLPQSIKIIDFLVLFLISSVVSVLPITIGGVGVRELTFLYGLKFIHQDPSVGVAFSFLFFFITMLSSLIGIFSVHKPLRI